MHMVPIFHVKGACACQNSGGVSACNSRANCSIEL